MLSPYPADFPYPDRAALLGDLGRCLAAFLIAGVVITWWAVRRRG